MLVNYHTHVVWFNYFIGIAGSSSVVHSDGPIALKHSNIL